VRICRGAALDGTSFGLATPRRQDRGGGSVCDADVQRLGQRDRVADEPLEADARR
jgi:hypothetical protein